MKHYGDITKISGYEAEIPDCVIGGSPCQDLSVAGKRAGLDGARSGLFMEQIRLVKELREHDRRSKRTDEPIRPRYMLWENVFGAFSSPGKDKVGEDFRCVLEEVAGVIEAGITIPRPEKGKWRNSGCVLLDHGSIAWRVFDAQYWGVPQRRRRICLLADFDGHTAADILFNRVEHFGESDHTDGEPSVGYPGTEPRPEVQPVGEGVSGDTQQGEPQGQEASDNASGGTGAGDTSFTMQERAGKPGGGKGPLIQTDLSAPLTCSNVQTLFQPKTCPDISSTLVASMCNSAAGSTQDALVLAIDMGGGKSSCSTSDDIAPTLCTTHQGEPAVVYDARGNGDGKTAPTMTGDHENRITDYTGVVVQPFRKQGHPRNSEEGQGWEEADKSDTLNVFDNSETRTPTVIVEKTGMVMYQREFGGKVTENPEISPTLEAAMGGGATTSR